MKTDQQVGLAKDYMHSSVPRRVDLASEFSKQAASAAKEPMRPTTIMLRNVPNRYSQKELRDELEDIGFSGAFDFLYTPLDKGTLASVGYAFVNFVTPEWADKAIAILHGYRFKKHVKGASSKVAVVSVAHLQGLEANLAHYENAAVNNARLKQRRPIVLANIMHSLIA